ncbi:GTPase-activating Rap/Ran-GAP domain-like protein 3 [Sparganum proliferum]
MDPDILYNYRNNAGRFRVEAGVQVFWPTIARGPHAPVWSFLSDYPTTGSVSTQFRSGERLKNSCSQDSCPSILLSGSHHGPQVLHGPAGDLKKLQSSSAPNEELANTETAAFLPAAAIDSTRYSKRSSVSRPVHLENPERETRWYFKYFLGKAHQLYCGSISEKDPMLLAIVKSEFEAEGLRQYRAILWTKFGSQKLCVSNNFSSSVSPKKMLSLFDVHRPEKGLREILHYEAQKEVLTLEEQEGSVNFKFGVVYCKDGQTSDEEMYNNETGCLAYQAFLRLLGDRVVLKNWDRFKGGLDAKTETTGTESVYTIYEGHEIMFHVSTLLPLSTDNRQQIERKRHIGNDIVNIIFFDTEDVNKPISWKPSMMKTHFTHIFAVVTFNPKTNGYRLSVFAEESVPYFGPTIPTTHEFTDHEELRHFLLVKLINGEKAAFHSPVFAQKRIRTFEMLLNNILEKYGTEANTNTPYRRAFSEIVPDSSEGSPVAKEHNRNEAFIRFGQMLKLNTIIRGDAPTSCITTGISKHIPWQPHRLHMKLHGEITCGDAWGKVMVVGSDFGAYALEEHQPPLLLIDRTVEVKQLKVVESAGIMIIRYDKGRETRVSVMQLSCLPTVNLIDRLILKKYALERSKGCHIFATSTATTRPLRLVCAVGRRLLIFQWQMESIGRSLSSWNQFTYSDLTAHFVFVREVPTSEPVQVLDILDSNQGGRICAGYRNQFDLLDERTGETLHLYRTENCKSQAVAVVEMRSGDDLELLLCFNRNCYLQRLTPQPIPVGTADFYNFPCPADELEQQYVDGCAVSSLKAPSSRIQQSSIATTTNFNLSWNFEPKNIVLAPPYILAFMESAIEFRLLINGSLVHTMTVPNCLLISAKDDLFFASSSEALHQSVLSTSIRQCPLVQSTLAENPVPPQGREAFKPWDGGSQYEKQSSNSQVASQSDKWQQGENVAEALSATSSLRPQMACPRTDREHSPASATNCLAMGSALAGTSDATNVGQPTRYIYYIALQALTGRISPDRSCESPNPVRIMEKIREFQDSEVQLFPLSPS